MDAHKFEDGNLLISECVIDIALNKTKGRATREEEKDLALVADAIRNQRDTYKALMDAAVMYIKLSPCDPDHTVSQWEAYQEYQNLLKEYEND